jgi:hypothetical protein
MIMDTQVRASDFDPSDFSLIGLAGFWQNSCKTSSMITGRRASDWLSTAPGPGERRDSERRTAERRAPRRPLDPMFAATLINQIAASEPSIVLNAYTHSETLPRGRLLHRWA